jgi:hypothetical protein
MKLALVIWYDACYAGSSPRTLDNLGGLVEMHSAGVLVAEDSEKLTLATDWAPEAGEYRHVHHIPRVNIAELRVVDTGAMRTKRAKG